MLKPHESGLLAAGGFLFIILFILMIPYAVYTIGYVWNQADRQSCLWYGGTPVLIETSFGALHWRCDIPTAPPDPSIPPVPKPPTAN